MPSFNGCLDIDSSITAAARCRDDDDRLKLCVPEDLIVTVVVGRSDPLMRPGLMAALGDDRRVRILADAVEGTAVEGVVVREKPRVLILDERDAGSALERLRQAAPETGVLVLAHDPSLADGMRLLAAGAACLARSASAAELLAAVQLVAQGGRMFMSADGQRIERRYPSNAPPLTRRERDVLGRLSRGRSNAEIALALDIGVETVRTHVARVLRKLGARNRQDLIGMPIPSPSAEQV